MNSLFLQSQNDVDRDTDAHVRLKIVTSLFSLKSPLFKVPEGNGRRAVKFSRACPLWAELSPENLENPLK